MADADKTVFISYRRNVSAFIARAVFMDLRQHGFDVFMDVESIDSGVFDTIILNQIAARTHFLIILTPGSLERCHEPDDWLRREIEYAIEQQRNIVPLLVNGFTFKEAAQYLAGELSNLGRFNALEIPHAYFEEAMSRLRNRFLKQSGAGIIKPAPEFEAATVQQMIQQATNQPPPTEAELSSEAYFWRAMKLNDDSDEEIAYYTEAIRLDAHDLDAYNNRGEAYFARGEYTAALADFERADAILSGDDYVVAGLAITHHALGNWEQAKSLWLTLVSQDKNFLDADWVREELDWHPELVEEARKLIANL